MKMKRIALLLLSFVMILSSVVAVPLSITAAEATGADEATAGYKAENVVDLDTTGAVTMTEFAAGTDATLISISTPAEFKLFAEVANNLSAEVDDATGKYTVLEYTRQTFAGKTVFLTADIDMTGVATLPIGVMAANNATSVWGTGANDVAFKGTFDGQGHKISNLTMENKFELYPGNDENVTATANTTSFGVFGITAGTIKNVEFVNAVLTSAAASDYLANGGLIGVVNANTLVENVDFNATVTASGHNGAGIGGRINGACTFKNVTVSGFVTSSAGRSAAGYIGYQGGESTFENCVNNATITGGEMAGGFTHRINQKTTFINCINNGVCYSISNGTNAFMAGFVAGVNAAANQVVGETKTLTFIDCTNTFADFAMKGSNPKLGTMYTDNFYNLYNAVQNGTGVANKTHVTLTNCKYVEQLDAGYDPGKVEWVDTSEMPEIMADTSVADIQAASAFKIASAEGMLRFNYLVNANPSGATESLFTGKTVYLAADIDMSGAGNWLPIGARPNNSINNGVKDNGDGTYEVLSGSNNRMYAFHNGIFDGQGYTISGLTSVWNNRDYTDAVGLFGISYGGVIRNVILDETCTFVAPNCYSVGSIIGYNGGMNIYNCKSSATVNGDYAGGIAGGAFANDRQKGIFFCTFDGTVQGKRGAAGMNGTADNAGTTISCVNYGTITANGGRAAGIVAAVRGGGYQIRNNINYGSVSVQSGNLVASIAVANQDVTTTANLEYRMNHNYGSVAHSANGSGYPESNIVTPNNADGAKAIAEGTALVTIWGNVDHNAYLGYNASMIVKKNAYNFTDIKSVWKIENGTAVLKGTEIPRQMKITDAEGLRILSAVVYFGNNLAGYTFYLTKDIDMSGYKFNVNDTTFADPTTFFPIGYADASAVAEVGNSTPFDGNGALAGGANGLLGSANATYTKYFSGSFDGQGHTISNWTVDLTGVDETTGGSRIGLFGLTKGALIQNLVFDETNTIINAPDTLWAGIIAEAANTAVHNVWNQADRSGALAGGIIGAASMSTLTNCTNDGDITANGVGGGLVGWGIHTNGVGYSRNNGNVDGGTVGGFFGATGTEWEADIVDDPETLDVVESGKTLAGFRGVTRILNAINNGKVNGTVAGAFVGFSTTAAGAPGGICVAGIVDWAGNEAETGHCPLLVPAPYYVAHEVSAMEQLMLNVGYQYGTGDNAGNVRLVTTVDALGYEEVGFILTRADGKQAKIVLTTVYNSITGADETYTPASEGACTSEYFAVFTINGVPESFTVQAYVVTASGATVYGAVETIPAPVA